jgi:uncharacterized protein
VLKAILLLLAGLLVLWYFSRTHKEKSPSSHSGDTQAEKMVVCAHCHLHIPASESIADAGRYFCSDEHRQLGTS